MSSSEGVDGVGCFGWSHNRDCERINMDVCIRVLLNLTRVMLPSGERAGWTGDSAFASESECFDFDTGAFFSQFMNQIRQGQCADGTIGNVVPATDPRRDGG